MGKVLNILLGVFIVALLLKFVFGIISGLLWAIVLLFGSIVLIGFLIEHISDKYPNSKMGKISKKILETVEDLLHNILSFV